MRFLLDTNTCIRYINGRAPRIRDNVDSKSYSDIVVSSITKGEMFYGSTKSQVPERSRAKQDDFLRHFESLPFDDDAADANMAAFAPILKSAALQLADTTCLLPPSLAQRD